MKRNSLNLYSMLETFSRLFYLFSLLLQVPHPILLFVVLKEKKKNQQRNSLSITERIKSKKNNRMQCLVVSKCITMKLGSIYCFVIIHTYSIFDQYFDILF